MDLVGLSGLQTIAIYGWRVAGFNIVWPCTLQLSLRRLDWYTLHVQSEPASPERVKLIAFKCNSDDVTAPGTNGAPG